MIMSVWNKGKKWLYAGVTMLAVMLMNQICGCAGVLASEGAQETMDAQTAWILVGIIAVAVIVAVIIAAVTSVISGVVGAKEDSGEQDS